MARKNKENYEEWPSEEEFEREEMLDERELEREEECDGDCESCKYSCEEPPNT